MTIGMAYDAAGGRPQFDLRSGALAVKMDLSFLRAKAVPLGVAVLAIAAFAAGSAYADLYRLRKAEKMLATRLATETRRVLRRAEDRRRGPRARRAAAAASRRRRCRRCRPTTSCSRSTRKVPPKDKITLDIDKLDIDDQKVDIDGHGEDARGDRSARHRAQEDRVLQGSPARPDRRPARTASRSSSSPSPPTCM